MYNINGFGTDCIESLWKLVSKDRFLKLKDIALNTRLAFGNTYVYESTFSTMKQVKSKNRNRMADETQEDMVSDLLPLTLVLTKER